MDSLYKLTSDYQEALSVLEDLDDEAVVDTLDAMKGTIKVKSTNVAKFIGNLDASATAIKGAMDKMATRKKAIENKSKRIREYLKKNMEVNKIHRIECPEFTLKIVNNPPKVVLGEMDLVPIKYKSITTEVKIDKNAIKKDLLAGKEVSGSQLQNSTRLDIK